jgi:type I restriction enzyme, S subunit
MRKGVVSSSELAESSRRLNAGYFLAEDEIAVRRIRNWTMDSAPMGEIVADLYSGPIFRKTSVTAGHGIGYVSANDLFRSHIAPSDYLSSRQVDLIDALRLVPSTIVLTCSGMNLGRPVWIRHDMDGLAGSGDLIRIVPNNSKAPGGFVYAFLASRYGVASVRRLIFGGHIKHVAPNEVRAITVPRLGYKVERRAHKLINEAAQLRADAAAQIADTVQATNERLKLPTIDNETISSFSVNIIPSSRLNVRLDAPYHSQVAARALAAIAKSPVPVAPLAQVMRRCFKPPMFKRLWVDDRSYGRQFISGVDAYRYQAESVRYVSNKTPNFDEFILEEGTVIFQAAGQIYGLFGQPLFVFGWLSGLFAADDLYRLQPHTVTDGGYLFAFLKTSVGQVLIKRQASGNSIPRVWDPHIRDISIPWPDAAMRKRIGEEIIDAHEKIERARVFEVRAVALVERGIEEAA